ncbi:MAG: SUF system Fe-S cluster assembly protein [Bacteroidia bacterium]|nr:SUF system Fe-S cluster assembly protein [Bacteroidia bacterium]
MTKEQLQIKNKAVELIKTVYDPEIPVNIYELGLVYEVTVKEENNVHVLMTLTAPACPAAEIIPEEVKEKVGEVDGVNEVEVEITFEPEWNQDMMSDEAKLELGLL